MGEIASSVEDGVLLLRLRNGSANAFSANMARSLADIVAHLPADVGAVVICGTSGGAFCAGSDIRELIRLQETGDGPGPLLRAESEALRAFAAISVPTITAIDGVAFGGGMELAACCDLVIASEKARFCLPEIKLGVFPGLGGTVWIPRRIGYTKALEMMLTGVEIDARTALDWNFVNRVVAPGEAEAEALKLARSLASGAREAAAMIKQSLRDGYGLDESAALTTALDRAVALGRSAESREGLRAFMAREAPDFGAARRRSRD